MGSEVDPAGIISELDRALRGVPDPPACYAAEVLIRVAVIEDQLAKIDRLLDEFLPLIRAYLDPDQSGPRGAFMRRRLSQAEKKEARDGR